MIPLATITPSANWVVEATTIALLSRVPGVVPIFARVPVPGDAYDMPAMEAAALSLAAARPAGIVWNGSKGGLLGLEHDHALCARITAATGISASTAALEMERAHAALGRPRLGVMTPYDDATAAALRRGFARAGWDIAAEDHLGLSDNLAFAAVGEDEILAQAKRLAGRCDALCAWCTNYPAGLLRPAIEAETGLPLLDATTLGVMALRRISAA